MRYPKTLLSSLCALTLLILAGCSHQVQVVRHVATVPAQTNAIIANGFTNFVIVPESTVTNFLTNSFDVVNPAVQSTMEVVSSLTSVVAPQFAGPLNAVFGLSLAILGFIVKKKNEHAKLVPSLIAGIEAGANNEDVKKSVAAIAQAAGHGQDLFAVVKSLTASKN